MAEATVAGQQTGNKILIWNVRIFNGLSDEVRAGYVEIEGQKIAAVGSGDARPKTTTDTVVIDGARGC
jgi:adenine deaminase